MAGSAVMLSTAETRNISSCSSAPELLGGFRSFLPQHHELWVLISSEN
jgi:hypothetical protein